MVKEIKTPVLEPVQGIQAAVDKLFLWNPTVALNLITQINAALVDAETDAGNAAASALAASQSATAAASSASDAASSASSAASSAESAAVSESNAAASDVSANAAALEAQTAATAAAESAERTAQNEQLLQEYVEQAASSASSANQDAASAQSSAGAAASSASSAASSAESAESAKIAAAASETAAAGSATAAAESATAATNSATSAGNSATSASDSAASAATSATNAATSETNAAGSATAAATSATSAASSASAASGSASAAATSETNAAASAAQAASAVERKASSSVLGSIRIGDTLEIDNDGVANMSDEMVGRIKSIYGESTTAKATVEKVVSIPSIQTLTAGQIIIIKPTITSTVANSTIKLNNFDAYPMKYMGAAITTSTDSIVWAAGVPALWYFDGSAWHFIGHGQDSNTTYAIMTVADGIAGTATAARTLSAAVLKAIILGTILTGLDTTTGGVVTDADDVLTAIGKILHTLSGKQNTLTAGTGININGDTISATATAPGFSDITGNPDDNAALAAEFDTKANATDLTSHTSDTTVHITAAERTTWNGKQDALTAGAGLKIENDVISVDTSYIVCDATDETLTEYIVCDINY